LREAVAARLKENTESLDTALRCLLVRHLSGRELRDLSYHAVIKRVLRRPLGDIPSTSTSPDSHGIAAALNILGDEALQKNEPPWFRRQMQA